MKPAHNKLETLARVADMAQHFSQAVPGGQAPPDCLPFPAGPLLPRQETHSRPLLPSRHGSLGTLERIRLAYGLWPESTGGQHTDKAEYTVGPNRLHLLSVRTWCDLHQRPQGSPIDVVQAWSQCLDRGQGAKWESPHEYDQRIEREELIFGRLKASLRTTKKEHDETEPLAGNAWPRQAYAHPDYECQCHPTSKVKASRQRADVDQIHTARRAFQQDLWAMLQRFWFKQLHSHHGQAWDLGLGLKYIRPYHAAALSALHALRGQPDHPLASVACALMAQRLLPPSDPVKLKGWYQGLASPRWPSANGLEGQALPPALCPGTMGHPAHSLQWLLKQTVKLGLSKGLILAVDTLAREVASLMTDPWTSNRLQWCKADAQALQTRLTEETKPRKLGALVAQVDTAAGFVALLDRRRAMQKYLQWSSSTWHQRELAVSRMLNAKENP